VTVQSRPGRTEFAVRLPAEGATARTRESRSGADAARETARADT